MAKGPETQARLRHAAQHYAQLWHKGHVGGPQMVKALAELSAWLRLVGLAPDANPALAAFLDSRCLRTVMAEIKPPDCDAKRAPPALARDVSGKVRRGARVKPV